MYTVQFWRAGYYETGSLSKKEAGRNTKFLFVSHPVLDGQQRGFLHRGFFASFTLAQSFFHICGSLPAELRKHGLMALRLDVVLLKQKKRQRPLRALPFGSDRMQQNGLLY
ncbi:hypothetical protein [Geomonas sp. Red276]